MQSIPIVHLNIQTIFIGLTYFFLTIYKTPLDHTIHMP